MSTSTSTRAGDVPGSVNETRIVLRPSGDGYVGGGCLVALPIVILPTAIGSVVARGGRMSDLLALPILALIVMLMVGLAILPSHVIIDSSGFHRRGSSSARTSPGRSCPPGSCCASARSPAAAAAAGS